MLSRSRARSKLLIHSYQHRVRVETEIANEVHVLPHLQKVRFIFSKIDNWSLISQWGYPKWETYNGNSCILATTPEWWISSQTAIGLLQRAHLHHWHLPSALWILSHILREAIRNLKKRNSTKLSSRIKQGYSPWISNARHRVVVE